MAENLVLDTTLREAFDRLAEPGDPAGVADALRERLAAGDTGTTVEGDVAPGFGSATSGGLFGSSGGMFGGTLALLPWVAVIVAAGLVGTALGFAGAFGRTVNEVPTVGYTAILDTTVPAHSCPGGPVVTTLTAGTRVLAVARSDDDAQLGIRNPNNVGTVVWLDTANVRVDGQQALDALPVGDPCPQVNLEVVLPEPEPAPEPPTPAPNPPAPPAPNPGDTTNPTLGTLVAQYPWYGGPVLYNQDPLVLIVPASDNVGVTGVKITWSNQYSGSAQMTKSGNTWKYTFTPPTSDDGTITFTVQARDAAGNLSTTRTMNVDHQPFG